MPERPGVASLVAKAGRMLLPRVKTAWAYLDHRLRGTPYASFYARMMDIRLQYNPDWGVGAAKEFQLEFLKTQGLQPSMRLLDYGCGAASAGRHFIRYLEPRRYTGTDISESVLAEARRRIAEWGLAPKDPEFLLLPAGSLDPLAGRRFDIVWAQSVLTHMPPDDIRRLFSRIPDLLQRGGTFYGTFARSDTAHQSQLKDWHYPADTILGMARDCGLQAELVSAWHHPQDATGRDTLVRLTAA